MKRSKIEKSTAYKTTDGKIFLGKGAMCSGAKGEAEEHQRMLDTKQDLKNGVNKFDTFMRGLFGIEVKYDPGKYPDEEREFCERIMPEVMIYAEDGDFRGEISSFFLDLFAFVGPDKWLKIHEFITKEM